MMKIFFAALVALGLAAAPAFAMSAASGNSFVPDLHAATDQH